MSLNPNCTTYQCGVGVGGRLLGAGLSLLNFSLSASVKGMLITLLLEYFVQQALGKSWGFEIHLLPLGLG